MGKCCVFAGGQHPQRAINAGDCRRKWERRRWWRQRKTVSNHGVTPTPSTCTNGTTTCAQSGSDTKAVVGTTGDTLLAVVFVSANAAQDAMYGACTMTASDGTNTYTFLTAGFSPGVALNSNAVWPFYAKNATAGSYYLSFTLTGAGCTFNYISGIYWVDLAGASTTAPIDTSVTNTSASSGGAGSITSSGNITNSGEVAICLVGSSTGTPTFTGAFSTLDTNALAADASAVNPVSGSTVTCSMSPFGANAFSILAVTH